jgi:hypothetical protein
MSEHVRDDELMDAVEGAAAPTVRQHVQACAVCRERVEQAAAGLDLARAADVPEPSPLYWDAFRKQVGRRVGHSRRSGIAWLPALAAAAIAALAIGWLRPAPPSTVTPSPLPAWSASLPPVEEDAGLAQLGTLAVGTTDEWAAVGCRGLSDCLSGLSEEETRALADVLSQELEGGGDL